MLRSSLLAVSAAILCTAASGQQQVQAKKVLGPVRDAGIYHVATGTWTRAGGSSNISPDCIYRNDANSGYFGTGWEGCKGVDEIMLPGTGGGSHGYVGPQDAYLVDGMSFSWCKNGAGTTDWTFTFYDGFVPCDLPNSPAGCLNPVGAITFAGLPGGSACWILTVDMAGGYEVCFDADGGVCAPGYQGGGLGLDHAGVQHQWTTTDGGLTGPILNGNPTWDTPGGYTCYNNVGNCGTTVEATGLGTQDLFTIDSGVAPCTTSPGCYFFGGYLNKNGCDLPSNTPIGSFNLCLFADCTQDCTSAPCGVVYCDTNPDNVATISIDACTVANNVANVSMNGAVPGQFSYLLTGASSGTVTDPPGAQGDLCLIGSKQGRYNKDVVTTSATGGATTDIVNNNSQSGGPWSLPTGLGVITAGSTWNFQYWYRDGMNPAKFSQALAVTFK